MPEFLVHALVGLGAGSVLALTKLRNDLCVGETPPTPRETAAAWSAFAIFMWTSLFFSGALTGGISAHLGKLASWPLVAAGIGLLCNGLWPLVTAVANEEAAEYVRSVFRALRGVKS